MSNMLACAAVLIACLSLDNNQSCGDNLHIPCVVHDKEWLSFCNFLQTEMTEPVIAADGHTYERAAIEAWFTSHCTSPITHQQLNHTRLVPNYAVKQMIAANKG